MDCMKMDAAQFARLFDNTLLSVDLRKKDIEALCRESGSYHFASVAVNPGNIPYCRELLQGSDVLAGAAIAFPLGQTLLEQKLAETSLAIEHGAQEIDYMINIGRLKDGDLAYMEKEMRGIVDICHSAKMLCKVIFENCYLTKDEIRTMCEVALAVGPDFIKTSTGFGKGGATVEDVRLMKQCVGDRIKVKAAGGIRTLDDATAMVNAGAERLGSSRSAAIVDAFRQFIARS